MLIFGLMLLKTAACLDQFCRFHQDSNKQCYAALGHKLNLQINQIPYEDFYLYKVLNDGRRLRLFSMNKNKQYDSESIRNRSDFFFDNLTLTINNVTRADSGTYEKHEIDIDAVIVSELQVIVEAPIGSVEVSSNCSSNQRSVFCSAEGDQLLYSWTLNGHPLMDGNSSIDLDERTDGDISCSVKNHVSQAQNTTRLRPCPVSVVFVLVWCLQMMVLFGLLGAFHIYMRHTSGKKHEDQKVRRRLRRT